MCTTKFTWTEAYLKEEFHKILTQNLAGFSSLLLL